MAGYIWLVVRCGEGQENGPIEAYPSEKAAQERAEHLNLLINSELKVFRQNLSDLEEQKWKARCVAQHLTDEPQLVYFLWQRVPFFEERSDRGL